MKVKAEDNLAPVRNQLVDLIPPNSKVIEFGCGKGDLLFKLSPKIRFGLGIDKSKSLIEQGINQKERKRISNVGFLCEALGEGFRSSEHYDFSIASLFFHVIPVSDAIYLFNAMMELSDTMLICGFTRPDTMQQKLLLWLDQKFSDHYKNFKVYQKQGYLAGLLAEAKGSNVVAYDSHIPFVKIYKIH